VIATEMGPDGDLVATRLARGCRCFGVWRDGDLAGYGWLSTGPEWIGELELEITPGTGEGYIWNCFTLSHLRRRGVLRALLAGIRERAQEVGLKRVWIGSVAIPAEKAFGPLGFKPALAFEVVAAMRLRLMRVRAASDADTALVLDASKVIGVVGQPLRFGPHLRLSHPRRH
jgi:GNAT superfamily N-acetyltransferase